MRVLALCAALVVMTASAEAAGDAKHGEEVFGRCAMCHNVVKGGGNGMGPNLFAVVGRKAGAVAGFPYSDKLKNSKIVWSEDNLRKWVKGPQKMVPGTRMVFAGITRSQDADDVVAYLKTRK